MNYNNKKIQLTGLIKILLLKERKKKIMKVRAFIGEVVHAPFPTRPGEVEYLRGPHAVVIEEESGIIIRVLNPEDWKQQGKDNKDINNNNNGDQEENHAEEQEKKEAKLLLASLPSDLELVEVIRLRKGQFMCPGFIDTHCHAPQFAFTGTATDLPLMKWLQNYTFPAEAACEDEKYASHLYHALVRCLLRHGTTSALYYATIHLESSKRLVEICEELGQRAWVGKVSMDRLGPENYVETTEGAIRDATAFVEFVMARQSRLVEPVITPRFIPSCSEELLTALGALASRWNTRMKVKVGGESEGEREGEGEGESGEYEEGLGESGGIMIQSHCSETLDEVAFCAPCRDTAVFEKVGLLTCRAVMAHCVWLTDGEMNDFSRTGAAISHCPLSNALLSGGHLQVRHAVDTKKVKVGLGSDVAGGYHPSLLVAMRHAVVGSKTLSHRDYHADNSDGGSSSSSSSSSRNGGHEDEDRDRKDRDNIDPVFDYRYAFWLATTGGAVAVGRATRGGPVSLRPYAVDSDGTSASAITSTTTAATAAAARDAHRGGANGGETRWRRRAGLGAIRPGFAFDALIVDSPAPLPSPPSFSEKEGPVRGHNKEEEGEEGDEGGEGEEGGKGRKSGSKDEVVPCAPGKKIFAYEAMTIGGQPEALEHRLQRFVNLGDDRNIESVWVAGRKVV